MNVRPACAIVKPRNVTKRTGFSRLPRNSITRFSPSDLVHALPRSTPWGGMTDNSPVRWSRNHSTGGVKLLGNVLHETVSRVQARWAVILPAALEQGVSLGVHARNAVMEVAPFGGMQGMHETVFGMRPVSRSALG